MPARRKINLWGLILIFTIAALIPGFYGPSKAQASTYRPEVTTNSASSIDDDSATLNGEIDDDGGDDITQYGFYWGTDSDLPDEGTRKIAGYSIDEGEEFDYDLTGLKSDTKYYFVAYARNSEGTDYGTVKNFTTDDNGGDAPTVITNSADDIGDDYATLNGEIDDIGGSDIEEYGFYWGTSSSCSHKKKVGTSIDEGDDFDYDLEDLDEDTKYYFKAYAINDDDIDYGTVKNFTTGEDGNGDEPSVTTKTPSISNESAKLYGVVTSSGGSDITSYGFYWGTDSDPGTRVVAGTDDIDEDETFSYSLNDLTPGKTYYFKAYARNDDGYDYGSVLSFTVEESGELASLTTKVSDISAGGATLTGMITSNGGATIREYGFVWGKTGGAETKIRVGSNMAANTNFLYFLGGLQNGNGYYVKSYAVNAAGTAYGPSVSFTVNGVAVVSPVAGSPGTPPVVSITSPGSGISVARGTALTINATATDDGSVVGMGLYFNGVKKVASGGNWLAYYLDTRGMSSGLYTVRVTAWDGSQAGEKTVTFSLK